MPWFRIGLLVGATALGVIMLIIRRRWGRTDEQLRHEMRRVSAGIRTPPRGHPVFVSPGPTYGGVELRRSSQHSWGAAPTAPALPAFTSSDAPFALESCRFDLEQIGSMTYRGRGIEPARHPEANNRNFGAALSSAVCGRCKSHRVLVIDLRWSVHPYSGDAYWDFATRCTECNAFNHHNGQS